MCNCESTDNFYDLLSRIVKKNHVSIVEALALDSKKPQSFGIQLEMEYVKEIEGLKKKVEKLEKNQQPIETEFLKIINFTGGALSLKFTKSKFSVPFPKGIRKETVVDRLGDMITLLKGED